MIKLEADDCFEYAIMASLLSRNPVEFSNVKCIDSFIEVLDYFKLVSPELRYVVDRDIITLTPGFLQGGKLKADVCKIPLCLTNIITLSPFLPEDIELEVIGITNYDEFSVDIFKVTFFKILRIFEMPLVEINIKKRGFAPEGDGKVLFKGKSIRKIEPIDYQVKEPLSKIRGFVITARIGSDFAHRMITQIKEKLSDLANTKVLCIVNNRDDSGPSAGYECSVLGESDNGVFYKTINDKDIPEKMAATCCKKLLQSILTGGIFDKKILPIVIMYMGLAQGISKLQIGKLDKNTKKVLNILNIFFKVKHKFSELDNVLTIVGCRYNNVFRPL